ncbi:MAG: hypothetical protein V9E83_01065 [Baekduia sp.]
MSDELETLSDRELHDRAFKQALGHADIGFFQRVLAAAPAAHAGSGELDDAYNDVLKPSSLLTELVHRDPEVLTALRPLYLDYLRAV